MIAGAVIPSLCFARYPGHLPGRVLLILPEVNSYFSARASFIFSW